MLYSKNQGGGEKSRTRDGESGAVKGRVHGVGVGVVAQEFGGLCTGLGQHAPRLVPLLVRLTGHLAMVHNLAHAAGADAEQGDLPGRVQQTESRHLLHPVLSAHRHPTCEQTANTKTKILSDLQVD